MRNYYKVYHTIKLYHEQLIVSPQEKKDYGFISKWRITPNRINEAAKNFGIIIQKYTGKTVHHPGSIPNTFHRERIWTYDISIGHAMISGQAPTMNKAILVLVELLENDYNLVKPDLRLEQNVQT